MTERIHGRRGVKRHQPIAETSKALAPLQLSGVGSQADFTFGRTQWGMQGNDRWSNCWFAALVHLITVQATVSFDEVPTFVSGFTALGSDTGVEWYNRYQVSQGQNPVAPGEGTDPSTGVAFALQEKLVYAAGVLEPTEKTDVGVAYFPISVLAEAIVDFQGGVIFCLALDKDAEQEFDNGEAWGTLSAVPDDNDGHATTGVKFNQDGDPATTCITWAELEGMTAPFDLNCIEGLCLVISQAFILKNGQPAADALVSKWSLQTQGEASE